MTKNEAIRLINQEVSGEKINSRNTHWSNIVSYGTSEGWWLNIPFYKFNNELNLILNNSTSSSFMHIEISGNSISSPESKFRNKNGTADIFMPCVGRERLVDMQSGSSLVDFNIFKTTEYKYK